MQSQSAPPPATSEAAATSAWPALRSRTRRLLTPAVALALLAACGGSSNSPPATTATPSAALATSAAPGDSCAVARPVFGVATDADREAFAYDANAPLNLEKSVEGMNNGIQVSRISYASPDGARVTGMFFDPISRTGARPGIILMFGTSNSRQMMGQAMQLTNHGAVVIAIDAPFHRRGPPPLRFGPQDRAEQVQLIKELRRAVDVLRSRPNVDPARIAFVGTSYGASIGALLAGVEPRLKAALLTVPDGGVVTRETRPGAAALANLPCERRVAWLRDMSAVEPIRFIPHAKVALMIQNGRNDTMVPAADAEALHKAAPQPKTIRWYPTTGTLNQQAVTDRFDWLNGQIGLDRMKVNLPPPPA